MCRSGVRCGCGGEGWESGGEVFGACACSHSAGVSDRMSSRDRVEGRTVEAQCGFEVVGVETDEEVAVSGEAVQYGTVGFCREAGDVENQRRMAGKLADCAEQPALILFRVVV